MDNDQLNPRRKFIGKAFFLAAIPLGFHFYAFKSSAESKITRQARFWDDGKDDLEKLHALLKGPDPVIWLFTGDSITLGAKHTHGYHCYPEVFQERIRWEISRYRDVVINTGISGHTTKDILNDFSWRVTQFKPTVVSLMIGTNDCKNNKWGISLDAFEQNLVTIVDKIRDMQAIPLLHTPPIVIQEKSLERKQLPDYVAVIKKIANDKNIVLVDNWGHWKDTLENRPDVDVYKNWFNDPNHPGAAGHAEIARLMFKKLNIFNPVDPTCGGVYFEGDH